MIDTKKTGRQIKEMCDKRGITVRQIQRELQIGSFQSVYSWFQGRTLPTLDNLYNLCKLLQVSMDSVIVEQGATEDLEFIICVEDNRRMSAGADYIIRFHNACRIG